LRETLDATMVACHRGDDEFLSKRQVAELRHELAPVVDRPTGRLVSFVLDLHG
jgi:hypothetical protein